MESQAAGKVASKIGLAQFLGDERQDLAQRLARVRASAVDIWKQPRLQWYTDHSAARHSERIIQLLGQLTESLQSQQERLSPDELYVLLAASYLHDIGMQDFRIDGRGPEELDIADYELIRDRHPERSKELIVKRALSLEADRDAFRIDLDDESNYLTAIALVSQAHGSSYFEETVAQLRRASLAPNNEVLRGPLLAALLLYADELDLHEDRALFPSEMSQSPVSALHHHVNHYVTRVEVAAGETQRSRRVQVDFSFPGDSDAYRGDIERYVVRKLSKQAGRVNPVLNSETNGNLEVERTVRVSAETEPVAGVRRALPAAARRHLTLELRDQRLIGRGDVQSAVTAMIAEARGGAIALHGDADSDFAAVFSWLNALADCRQVPVVYLDFQISAGRNPEDIVASIEEQENLLQVAPEQAASVGTLTELIDRSEQFRVWVLDRVDLLLPETGRWLREETSRLDGPVLVISADASESGERSPAAKRFELSPFTPEVLQGYLVETFGDTPEEAEMLAEQFQLLALGAPVPTLAAIEARMNRIRVDAND